jgi:hypothetical protein
VCVCVCPEMEKGWLLGEEPIISVALGEASVKGITLCQSSVSEAWLVMPIHWIRDEHTYMTWVLLMGTIYGCILGYGYYLWVNELTVNHYYPKIVFWGKIVHY